MNYRYFKTSSICIFIIIFSSLISCNKIETPIGNPVEEVNKDEIIDSLTNHIDSLFKEETPLPQSIVILDKEVTIPNGYITKVRFRVNPSSTEIDINLFKLDRIDAMTKGISYIKDPVYVKKVNVEKSPSATGAKYRGEYVMTIEDMGISIDYSETLAIVYAAKDKNGNKTEISSDPFTVTSTLPSSLPRVYIDTPEEKPITSKTEWLEGATIKIVDNDGTEYLDMGTSIRGRGNSTWGYPKKPYALKLDSKSEVLGMPKHKRWVLLANWMDRTLLRNDVAFEIGRRTMDWAPRGRFIELYLNGKHQGNYYLCEQIKPDENRVNIDDDGYILEFDTYGPYDEINYFYTPVKQYPVTIKEPDEEVITSWDHQMFLYISEYTGTLEQILENDKLAQERWEEVQELIDVRSYIDWWLIHEVTYNLEPLHPKSSYMHKASDGKLYAGPIWDFDWGTYQDYQTYIALTECLWYGYFFKYPEFKAAVKERWAEVRDVYASMDKYIEDAAAYIKESNDVNIYKWPLTSTTNGDEKLTFEKAITKMRSSYNGRVEAINNYIDTL